MKNYNKFFALSLITPFVLGACGTFRQDDATRAARSSDTTPPAQSALHNNPHTQHPQHMGWMAQDTQFQTAQNPRTQTQDRDQGTLGFQSDMSERDDERLSGGTVSFNRGSATLSPDAQNELREMLRSAQARGDINDIKVAVWSDNELPTAQNQQLSEADRSLARQRIEAIENFLHPMLDATFPNLSVDTFNMAERANWFARLFNTEQAELRSELARRGERDGEGKYRKLGKGGPSKASIVIETDVSN
jgi:outer membrane protein OmpA-like peptidoglycan-associated protein